MTPTEFANLLHVVANDILYAEELKKAHDCNDCAGKNDCPYAPKLGQLVRINCPLWYEKKTMVQRSYTNRPEQIIIN